METNKKRIPYCGDAMTAFFQFLLLLLIFPSINKSHVYPHFTILFYHHRHRRCRPPTDDVEATFAKGMLTAASV